MKNDPHPIGRRLQALRSKQGKTQSDVVQALRALDLPVTREVVANWECCRTTIPATAIPFLAFVLKARVEEILPELVMNKARR
jgi:transcriptional regulator with XRE-family HTH domain